MYGFIVRGRGGLSPQGEPRPPGSPDGLRQEERRRRRHSTGQMRAVAALAVVRPIGLNDVAVDLEFSVIDEQIREIRLRG